MASPSSLTIRSEDPFRKFFFHDMIPTALSYLNKQELRTIDSVNHFFRGFVNKVCERQCRIKGVEIPEDLLSKVNYKQLLLNRFSNIIGIDFFQKYYGKVKNVPIPRNFFEEARPSRDLILIPEEIEAEVDENSPLELSSVIGNGKVRLGEDADKWDNLEPSGNTKTIQFPVTIENMFFYTENYLKINLPSQFAGLVTFGGKTVIDEQGDVRVGPTHWSCQERDPREGGMLYPDQKELVENKGLEVVSLADRCLYHLFSYTDSGKIPAAYERTATVTTDLLGPCQATLQCWNGGGDIDPNDEPFCAPHFTLELRAGDYGTENTDYDLTFDIPVAVGVPPRSS